jgi:hypothetical protein
MAQTQPLGLWPLCEKSLEHHNPERHRAWITFEEHKKRDISFLLLLEKVRSNSEVTVHVQVPRDYMWIGIALRMAARLWVEGDGVRAQLNGSVIAYPIREETDAKQNINFILNNLMLNGSPGYYKFQFQLVSLNPLAVGYDGWELVANKVSQEFELGATCAFGK